MYLCTTITIANDLFVLFQRFFRPLSFPLLPTDVLWGAPAVHEPRGPLVHPALHSVQGQGQRGAQCGGGGEVQPRRGKGAMGKRQRGVSRNDLRRYPGTVLFGARGGGVVLRWCPFLKRSAAANPLERSFYG